MKTNTNWEKLITKRRFMVIGDDGICHSGFLTEPSRLQLIFDIRHLQEQERKRILEEIKKYIETPRVTHNYLTPKKLLAKLKELEKEK